jgi:hypothetical protein
VEGFLLLISNFMPNFRKFCGTIPEINSDGWYEFAWYEIAWYEFAWYKFAWYEIAWYEIARYEFAWYEFAWYEFAWYEPGRALTSLGEL